MLSNLRLLCLVTLTFCGSCLGQNSDQVQAFKSVIQKSHSLAGLGYYSGSIVPIQTNSLTDPFFPGFLSCQSGKITTVFNPTNGQIKYLVNHQRLKPYGGEMADANRTSRMTREAADAKALQIVTELGVPHWSEYRHWDGRYVLSNNFDPKRREWSYVWHRHVEKVPIWNEAVIVHLDDESGELVSLNNFSTSLDRQPPKTPRLSADEAKDTVVRVWTPHLQRKERSIVPYKLEPRTALLAYRHMDLSRDGDGNRTNPRAGVELRLIYVIGIRYGATYPDGTRFSTPATVLVDAENGMVWAERSSY